MARSFHHPFLFATFALATAVSPATGAPDAAVKRPHIQIRGVYGGVPAAIEQAGGRLSDYGINAIWYHSRQVNQRRLDLVKSQGALFFAEFNTLHDASFLQKHPDAAPVGADGAVSPPPDGWQGICPTHAEYRKNRMEAFRNLLAEFALDGIWLDYHHSHSSWEQPVPNMPDTCFCRRCLRQFQHDTGIRLPPLPVHELSRLLLDDHRKTWVQWRCDVLTDWVRQFRDVLDATRPEALLGTFHSPWTEDEHGGALRDKLAIDLRAQAAYLDVVSPMPYHARFGHGDNLDKISHQIAWLGRHLGLNGTPGERPRIWPIVQLSDTGAPVPVAQVQAVLEHGSRPPATGITIFSAGAFQRSPEKLKEMGAFYRAIAD